MVCAPFCLLALAVSASDDAGLRELRTEGCRVAYHRGNAALARRVGRATTGILRELNEDLGIHFRRPVRVWLTVTGEEFRERTRPGAPEWASAMALLDRNEIVVRAELVGTSLANHIILTMRHELCHLALRQAEKDAKARLPLWFHEGVATHLSGASLFQNPGPFYVAAVQGALIPLSELEFAFPRERSRAELAYLQCEAFIRFVAEEYSPRALRWWIDAFTASGDLDAAAREALGEDLRSLESRWRERHLKRFPWLHILWQATTLFGALAVAVIIVYFIRRARARKLRLRWEREDWRLGGACGDNGDWDGPDDSEDEDKPEWS